MKHEEGVHVSTLGEEMGQDATPLDDCPAFSAAPYIKAKRDFEEICTYAQDMGMKLDVRKEVASSHPTKGQDVSAEEKKYEVYEAVDTQPETPGESSSAKSDG